jgi:hypothetical protein
MFTWGTVVALPFRVSYGRLMAGNAGSNFVDPDEYVDLHEYEHDAEDDGSDREEIEFEPTDPTLMPRQSGGSYPGEPGASGGDV